MSGFTNVLPTERCRLADMFQHHRPSFIIDSVLQGHLGTMLVDDLQTPRVARLLYADIVALAGDPACPAARQMTEELPSEKVLMLPPNGWNDLLHEIHGQRLIKLTRHTFDGTQLDVEHLAQVQESLPDGYTIKRIDLELARQIDADKDLISEDHVHNYDSPEDFLKRGIGFCVLKGDRIVAGASSYAFCDEGIEVQVNTHPDFRKRGLATVVSASLLEHCVRNGIAAHWDAGNESSVKLALRLGYTRREDYEILFLE